MKANKEREKRKNIILKCDRNVATSGMKRNGESGLTDLNHYPLWQQVGDNP